MEISKSEFRLKTLVLGMVHTNCYIISNTETKEAIVIDPADEAEKIEQYLTSNDLVCKGILLTHGHFDHILAAAEISDKTNTSIYVHEADAVLMSDPLMNASRELIGRDKSVTADILLKDEQILKIAGFTIQVIHTPGHTAGGVCYYFSEYNVLFGGDTLFRENIGNTRFPTGDGKILIDSIKKKLMVFDDQVKVYPGHGMPTTIGHERSNNFYLSNDFYD